jgi:glucokinase
MFLTSQFRQFFEQKGALTGYLTTIPTYLIVAPDHALIGASAYLDKTSIGA